MKATTIKEETRTPKGVSQNWNFIQSYSTVKKKSGPFVSRLVRHIPKASKTEIKAERVVDNTTFTVKVNGESVVVMPRKNGKFSGKQQVYTQSVAKAIGLI